MIRLAAWTLVFAVIAALLAYYAIGAASGEGRSILLLMATVAALLGCAVIAMRRRFPVRMLLTLAASGMAALLVDQVAYAGWHDRVDRFVTGLQHDIGTGPELLAEEMKVRPSAFAIRPDQTLVLTFEPPLLAWTYHLDSAAPSAQGLIAGWFQVLATLPRGPQVDPLAKTIIRPHEAYSVSVMSSLSNDEGEVCRADGSGQWIVSVDAHTGHRRADASPASID
jgi:hypothetical protein